MRHIFEAALALISHTLNAACALGLLWLVATTEHPELTLRLAELLK
jgi:hypothetical protein